MNVKHDFAIKKLNTKKNALNGIKMWVFLLKNWNLKTRLCSSTKCKLYREDIFKKFFQFCTFLQFLF